MKHNYMTFLKNAVLATTAWLTLFLFSPCYASDLNQNQRDWTILGSFPIPGKASGLAWDGTWLYSGVYSGTGKSNIYRINPSTGTYEVLFTNAQINGAYGISSDGTHIYVVSRGSTGPSYMLKFDMAGTLISTLTLPAQYMSGVAYDGGNFWVQVYYPDPGTVYKIDNTGAILSQFTPPNDQPWDICKQGDDLWIADYNANKLHKVSQTGSIIEVHNSEATRPAGVVFDGTFLWYTDGPLTGNSTLYKVDLGGSGTPQIQAPAAHYFGNVTLTQSDTWNMQVNSTGTGELIINSISFDNPDAPISTSATFPINIAAGSSASVPLSFAPSVAGPLNVVAHIHSNDPITPIHNVLLTGYAVYQGPFLHAETSLFDFGIKRLNSTSRWWFEFQNTGNQPLTITQVESDNSDFFTDFSLELPLTLQTLQQARIGLWFQPSEIPGQQAIISIVNNSDETPFQVELQGSSEEKEYAIGWPLWNYQLPSGSMVGPRTFLSIPDVTDDQIDDVILCTQDNKIRCINGNASGVADIIWEITLGTVEYTRGITGIEDINGDEYPDIVVGTAWGDRAITALCSRTGEIIWRHLTNNYGLGGWVYDVDARFDYNGDGFPDVLAASGDDTNGQGPKRIYCLNGLTGAVIWECPINGAAFSVIGVNDFTGDGQPDVVAGATNAAQSTGRVIGINGATGAIVWDINTAGSAVWALEALADINGDNKPDVIAGTFNGSYYLLNAVNGGTIHSGSIGNNIIIDFFNAGDLNEDGFDDIAVNHSGTSAIVINGFNGNPLWVTPLADKSYNVSPMRDITGDGINDLAVGTLFQSNWIYYLNGADGSILHSFEYGEAVDALQAIPDISGDQSMEVVVGGRNGRIYAYSGGVVPQPDTFTVDFIVKENSANQTLLENAKITISPGEEILYTNSEGAASIELQAGNYEYLIEKEGYFPLQASFEIYDAALEITVLLDIDDTFVGDYSVLPFKIWNQPNPVKEATLIFFSLPISTNIEMNVFNVAGKIVSTPLTGYYKAGQHSFQWNTSQSQSQDLPNGIYFIELKTPEMTTRTRMLIVK